MTPEFAAVFSRLREMLRKHAGKFSVTSDTAFRYGLGGGRHPVHQWPMDLAWVQIRKSYVSFHHMGVSGCETLRESLSPLKARMQGKSCFNFKACDEALFAELERVTAEGFGALARAGMV